MAQDGPVYPIGWYLKMQKCVIYGNFFHFSIRYICNWILPFVSSFRLQHLASNPKMVQYTPFDSACKYKKCDNYGNLFHFSVKCIYNWILPFLSSSYYSKNHVPKWSSIPHLTVPENAKKVLFTENFFPFSMKFICNWILPFLSSFRLHSPVCSIQLYLQ